MKELNKTKNLKEEIKIECSTGIKMFEMLVTNIEHDNRQINTSLIYSDKIEHYKIQE